MNIKAKAVLGIIAAAVALPVAVWPITHFVFTRESDSMKHRDLVAQSLEELRLKTAAHDRLWKLGEADWSVDQDKGEIVFSAPNGMVARCSVQIIGTFNTVDSTWLWAWDHHSVQPPLQLHATRLREYGQKKGIPELTIRKLSVTEEQCWEFAALACKLNGAQGAYRGPSGPTFVFMTYGPPQLSSTSPAGSAAATENEAASEFVADIPADVKATVKGFIKALHDWEVAAYQATEKDKSKKARDGVSEKYHALIRKWCVAGLQRQNIAYGNVPKHDPDTERLLGASISENKCRVRTRHIDRTGFACEYEYHLRRENGMWFVKQLYYLDGDDKYEML